MNQIFEKSKKIILDEKYYLEPDGFRGIVLVLQETRKKELKDKVTKKGSGVFEDYIFTDKWYYPKLSMILQKYLQLTNNECKSIQELNENVLRLETKIQSL
jgi:hypothetical protein